MSTNNLKQVIRHFIKVLGLSFVFNKYRMFKGKKVEHLFLEGRQNRFIHIYEKKFWLEGRETGALSGLGSELENTGNIRKQLPEILTRLDVKSILDIGCGDWTWMQHVKLPCKYIGIDLVPAVIHQNIAKFSSPDIEFRILDAVTDVIPECDAILCREVIFHLSFSDAKKLLNNILETKTRFLMITNDTEILINADIETGDFRDVNLRLKPFYFPLPLMTIEDNSISANRKLQIWRLIDLSKYYL